MDIERRTLHKGIDSWDGEMTYQGITYIVEVDQKDSQIWQMEVLQANGGCLLLGRFFSSIQVLHYGMYPTLKAALNAATDYIRGLYPVAGPTQKG